MAKATATNGSFIASAELQKSSPQVMHSPKSSGDETPTASQYAAEAIFCTQPLVIISVLFAIKIKNQNVLVPLTTFAIIKKIDDSNRYFMVE